MEQLRPYKQVFNFLIEIIEQSAFAPDLKLPSERMLATKFNASRRSVRLAFDKLIDENLVIRIHGKGYFTTGKKEKKDKNSPKSVKKIYFIVPALKTVFAQDILNGITDFCDEHTMDVSVKLSKNSIEKESQYVNSAYLSDAKGIILFPLDNELVNTELLKLSANRFPVAVIDRYFQNVNSSFISTDNFNAMVEAVKFLKTKKHKNILYLTSPTSLATTVGERLNGFLAGIQKYYAIDGKESVITLQDFSYEQIFNGVTSYVKNNPLTEVIICPGVRSITDAIISALSSMNLSIPKDIKLMVFDNDFSYTEVNLIKPYVIEQDSYQIGYRSAAALYNQIYGDLRTVNIRLPTKIVDYSKKRLNKKRPL
ncbi:MAG: GntR family transcriptional regulator [Clostridia bacterium]|nr:GntR family transcriptional regulator [Clostridia bacterium]